MSHPEQIVFIERVLSLFPEFKTPDAILEIGSQNINGTVRDFFNPRKYIGIDINAAKDVDFVCPGELLELPDGWCDLAMSTECLEHAIEWDNIAKNAIRACKPKGLVIFTFAGLYRPCHGTIDSRDPSSSPATLNYYGNIDKDQFFSAIELGELFDRYSFEANMVSGDSYFWGIRSSKAVSYKNDSAAILAERLSRAQGQLGQALSRLASANKKISDLEKLIPE